MPDADLAIRLHAPLTDERYSNFHFLEVRALDELREFGVVPPGWVWDREGYFRQEFDRYQQRKAAKAAQKARKE